MELDLEKLAKKRLYKLTGVVVSFNWINSSTTIGSIGCLIVQKGTGSKKQIFKFTILGPEALAVSKLEKNYRIKIWFSIKTNEYKERLYTELMLKYHEYWQVNELKKKREAYAQAKIEESKYTKALNINFDNKDFLNDAFDQNNISEH